jgi:cell division protein FtsB
LLVAVAFGGIVFLFVLPGRTWLGQEHAWTVGKHQHSVLSQEDAALAQRIAKLQDPAYIAQIARQQYGMVMPGEQAYGIVFPAPPPTTAPPKSVAPRRSH